MRKIASPQELSRELMRLSAYVLTGRPERKRVGHVLRDLADRVETIGPRRVRATMGESDFWKITEPYGWGTKTKDYKGIEKDLLKKLTPEQAEELRGEFSKLKDKLYKVVDDYANENNVSADVGDDSFDDLLSHIIGLGKKEYDAVLKDPMRAITRGQNSQFGESFSYALPGKEDFASLRVDKYITWAQKIEEAYEAILGANEDDIPWVPRFRTEIEHVLHSMKAFIKTQDFRPLLEHATEIQKAAEDVGKMLRKVGQMDDAKLQDAVHTVKNHWIVTNLLTDLKHYMG